MKINEHEIEAAREVMDRHGYTLVSSMALNEAIHAVMRVRKARKAAKREKARENGKRLVKGVQELRDAVINGGDGLIIHTPKPLTIEAGKSYRTRDGQRVDIAVNDGSDKYCLGGKFYRGGLPGWWTIYGCYTFGETHELDLVSEWQE